jgi:dihydrofolate synthase/folylpolyglutamate synthase
MVMTYKQALVYFYSLTNYEVKSASAYAPQYFDLCRVQRLLDALGNPERSFRTIHVAGTKGKGSTSAVLASILQQAGYRTGLYTSPHLHSFRERIQLNGEMIREDEVARLAERIRPIALADPELTTFEVATALAFDHFARAGAQVVVVEVGLGGRLDATNVVQPIVAVITTIGHDHMHILGRTLAEIATEKAGIIKPGTPVVCALQEAAAMRVIERQCAERAAPLHAASRLWRWRGTDRTLQCQEFTASRRGDGAQTLRDLCLPLLGAHQLRNAVVALETVEVLRTANLAIDEQAVRLGLRAVRWPGRFELLGTRPYFVVDGAHNVDSARVLARAIHDYFPGVKPWFVLGILSDKDIPAILKQLLPIGAGAFLASSHHPRATEPHELQRLAAQHHVSTWVCESISEATSRAIEQAGPDGLVVAAGSFTTAGAAREAWFRLRGQPLPALDP